MVISVTSTRSFWWIRGSNDERNENKSQIHERKNIIRADTVTHTSRKGTHFAFFLSCRSHSLSFSFSVPLIIECHKHKLITIISGSNYINYYYIINTNILSHKHIHNNHTHN